MLVTLPWGKRIVVILQSPSGLIIACGRCLQVADLTRTFGQNLCCPLKISVSLWVFGYYVTRTILIWYPAGLFVNFVLLSGYLKSSGVFFVELLKKFNAPATHTALLFAIRAGIFSICGENFRWLHRSTAWLLVLSVSVCLSVRVYLSLFSLSPLCLALSLFLSVSLCLSLCLSLHLSVRQVFDRT